MSELTSKDYLADICEQIINLDTRLEEIKDAIEEIGNLEEIAGHLKDISDSIRWNVRPKPQCTCICHPRFLIPLSEWCAECKKLHKPQIPSHSSSIPL